MLRVTDRLPTNERLTADAPAINAPAREFLEWVARTPRTYGDTMAAWRSSCPRLTVWEDALAAGLVNLRRDEGVAMDEAAVVLTPLGRAALAGIGASRRT